jgi:AraC-like DNA-binding protein
MLQSTVFPFADPAEFRTVVRATDGELLVTSKGDFRSEVVRIDLNKLWMQRISDRLPRIIQASNDPSRAAILFYAHVKQSPMRHAGVDIGPHEIVVFNLGASFHHRTQAACQLATMSLTPADLAVASRAIIGRELTPPRDTRVVRPPRAWLARLMALHARAVRLAKEEPESLAGPATAGALEQDLVRAMVECLAGSSPSDSRSGGKHAKVIARFEDFLESRRFDPVYLAEICAAIGVSERTLRACCQEHLGMGPIHYLWLRRMHLAHRALLCADPASTTVTAVATEHGFWELGRFSVEYRALFGEMPSRSLQRPAAG